MHNVYKLAGHTMEIQSVYPQIHKLCEDYQADGPAEYTIATTEEDIAVERDKFERECVREGASMWKVSDGQMETLAVYRKLAQALVQEDVLLMHGAVIAVDGVAYLFTAKSGTGKTTHIRLWLRQFGSRAVVVNGDKPLLHVTKEGVTVYGTPWDGKEHMSSNMACPLKAVCVLTRSDTNYIEPISKREALPMLCQQCHRPAQPAGLAKMLGLVDRLADAVPLYRLGCNMDPEAALVSYRGMNPDKDAAIV